MIDSTLLVSAVSLVLLAPPLVCGHIAMWTPAMYGWCDGGNGISTECSNTNYPVHPLAYLPRLPGIGGQGWWFHGAMDQPPPDDVFEELPAGGSITAQIACNKALTKYQPGEFHNQTFACGDFGPLHTADTFDKPPTHHTQGCAIALAWESDSTKLSPEDFIIITTNRTCPFYLETVFHFPKDLPVCPPGGCHAFWLWIHEAGDFGGDTQQMYLTPFRAKITGTKNTTPLPMPRRSKRCEDAPGYCVRGPKLPHYWFQNDGNNSDAPDFDPPTYNEKYGMRDGAQLDLRYDASGEVPVWQGWTNLGCWAHQPGDSTGMEHQMKDDWTTTPGTCIAKCDALGYKYAGVEFAYQCFCSNSYGKSTQTSDSECNMACKGSSYPLSGGNSTTETCGSSWRMNLYRRDRAPGIGSSSTSNAQPMLASSRMPPVASAVVSALLSSVFLAASMTPSSLSSASASATVASLATSRTGRATVVAAVTDAPLGVTPTIAPAPTCHKRLPTLQPCKFKEDGAAGGAEAMRGEELKVVLGKHRSRERKRKLLLNQQ